MTDERTAKIPTTGRRAVLGAIAGSTTIATVGASQHEDTTVPGQAERRVVATTVEQAFTEQETLIESGRYCSVDQAVLEAIDRDVGDQIRVRRGDVEGEYAVYTISESRAEDDPIVRMSQDGRERLGTDETFGATVDTMVVRPDLAENAARTNDEFIEQLTARGETLLVLSPHGGDIAPGTDDQAALVAERVSSDVTNWGCKGWREGGGAFERWFVSPRDITTASFPELAQIADQEFAYSVSFRGLETDGVDVFGDEDGAFTQDIADAIESAVDDLEVSIEAVVAEDETAEYAAEPLTDRLTAPEGGNVWLGQSRDARDDHGEAIATAVADVLETRQ